MISIKKVGEPVIKIGANDSALESQTTTQEDCIDIPEFVRDDGTVVRAHKRCIDRVTGVERFTREDEDGNVIDVSEEIRQASIDYSELNREFDRLREVDFESEDGATFTLDGKVWQDGGLVIPIASMNTTINELSDEQFAQFIEGNRDLIQGEQFAIGLYKFPNSDQVSYDLNIVVEPNKQDIGVEIGAYLGQESLFNLDTFENIKTGSDGQDVKKITPSEVSEIVSALSENRLPDFIPEPLIPSSEEQVVSAVNNLVENENTSREDAVSRIGIRRPKTVIRDNQLYRDHLDRNEDGTVTFYHYSSKERESTAPNRVGQGSITSSEEADAFSGVGATFFYTIDDFREQGVGEVKHIVRIPEDEIYDYNGDPLYLYSEALEQMREYYGAPLRSFTSFNEELAWIMKVSSQLGYKMTIAKWQKGDARLRAQSNIILDLELAND